MTTIAKAYMSVCLVRFGITSSSEGVFVSSIGESPSSGSCAMSSGAIYLEDPWNEVVKPRWSRSFERPKSASSATPFWSIRTLCWYFGGHVSTLDDTNWNGFSHPFQVTVDNVFGMKISYAASNVDNLRDKLIWRLNDERIKIITYDRQTSYLWICDKVFIHVTIHTKRWDHSRGWTKTAAYTKKWQYISVWQRVPDPCLTIHALILVSVFNTPANNPNSLTLFMTSSLFGSVWIPRRTFIATWMISMSTLRNKGNL